MNLSMCFPLDNHPNHSTLSPMPTDRPEPVSMTVLNYVSLLHSFSFSDNLVPSRSVPMLSVPIGREVSPQCSPQPSETVESDLNCGKKDQTQNRFLNTFQQRHRGQVCTYTSGLGTLLLFFLFCFFQNRTLLEPMVFGLPSSSENNIILPT